MIRAAAGYCDGQIPGCHGHSRLNVPVSSSSWVLPAGPSASTARRDAIKSWEGGDWQTACTGLLTHLFGSRQLSGSFQHRPQGSGEFLLPLPAGGALSAEEGGT